MSIESIVPMALPVAPVMGGATAAAAQPDLFESLVRTVIDVNAQMISGQQAIRQLAAGETDNLHQVVIQVERARLAFDMVLQVRNKVLDAYQEVMRTQV